MIPRALISCFLGPALFIHASNAQDTTRVKILNALNSDSVLIGFNEIGSFHEYWQDFYLRRASPEKLEVTWIDDGGDTVRYDLLQKELDRFVDELVAFVPYESEISSSTFIVIYIRSKAGDFEYTYCRVERKRKKQGARLLRMMGNRERLQQR